MSKLRIDRLGHITRDGAQLALNLADELGWSTTNRLLHFHGIDRGLINISFVALELVDALDDIVLTLRHLLLMIRIGEHGQVKPGHR